MKAIKLEIAVGDDAVSALLLRPPQARALYLFAHGAGTDMGHQLMEANAIGLAERGIATLRYNFLYTERGSKRPDQPRSAHRVVRAAAEYVQENFSELPSFAGGRSFGGRMTSQAQSERPLPQIRGLAFLGFPLHPAGKPAVHRADHLKTIDLPMIFLNGSRDALAELDLLRPTIATLGKNAALKIIDQADHSFKVAKRSGRTQHDADDELLDALAFWMIAN
ncbi:hypothetical protein SAMN05518668_11635 [Sphingobium sp. YR657]|uniref:alpha/beta hydrolase family protein n=1 Tax=Sphingobium sp. YR657 TaxID=1884366 RepID=UPI00091D15FD|nr:alpha/beta family hydrolase [Sphingobium sp. YR657]SHM66694.1 hypothetical protein SAMN05518668_11635 [Sphingobium sp. YR657]